MNRDAKIGVVVILIIVALLVIIWGRDRAEDQEGEVTRAKDDAAPAGPVVNSIDARPSSPLASIEGGVRAVSPGDGARVIPSAEITAPETLVVDPPAPPVVVPPPPAAKPKNWQYTAANGDSLVRIAAEQLGDGKRWPEIAKLNNLADPYPIRAGQKLIMPPKNVAPTTADRAAPVAAPVAAASGNYRKYTVQDGDSLTLIAREQLKDGAQWKKIADINKLAKPYRIKAGQVLLLPE
ncbi:MAG: LysM peptidoglycan-binding domain-containing protein [Planctomycetota bacterium]